MRGTRRIHAPERTTISLRAKCLQPTSLLAKTHPSDRYQARKRSCECRLSTGTNTTWLASRSTLFTSSSDDGPEARQAKTTEGVNTLLQRRTVRFTTPSIHQRNSSRGMTATEALWAHLLVRRASTRWRREGRAETEAFSM